MNSKTYALQNHLDIIIGQKKCELLIFVDGDKSLDCLKDINKISPNLKFSHHWKIHVFISMKDPEKYLKIYNRPWITFCKSGNKYDALDNFLVISSHLCMNNYKNNVNKTEVIIMGQNDFSYRVANFLTNFNIKVEKFSEKFDIGLHILLTKDLDDLILVQDDTEMMELLRDVKSDLQEIKLHIESHKPTTLKQFRKLFDSKIFSELDRFMNYKSDKFFHIMARNHRWQNQCRQDILELTKDDLKEEILICWKESLADFCRENKICKTELCYWMKIDDGQPNIKIDRAIRTWIRDRN